STRADVMVSRPPLASTKCAYAPFGRRRASSSLLKAMAATWAKGTSCAFLPTSRRQTVPRSRAVTVPSTRSPFRSSTTSLAVRAGDQYRFDAAQADRPILADLTKGAADRSPVGSVQREDGV